MTDAYEFTEYKRVDLIYNFSTMTAQEITDVKARAAEAEKEAAAKKAAAAAAAAKPAATTETKTDLPK
jgi:formate hydrogenlyase subunit 6/NADH:ubiquinone oxidoreductase subunit I